MWHSLRPRRCLAIVLTAASLAMLLSSAVLAEPTDHSIGSAPAWFDGSGIRYVGDRDGNVGQIEGRVWQGRLDPSRTAPVDGLRAFIAISAARGRIVYLRPVHGGDLSLHVWSRGRSRLLARDIAYWPRLGAAGDAVYVTRSDDDGATRSLLRIPLDGGEPTVLHQAAGLASGPIAVSGDERSVAITGDRETVASLDGGPFQPIGIVGNGVGFDPSGRLIYIGGGGVSRYDPATEMSTLLVADIADAWVSPMGRWLVVLRRDGRLVLIDQVTGHRRWKKGQWDTITDLGDDRYAILQGYPDAGPQRQGRPAFGALDLRDGWLGEVTWTR